MSIANSIPQHIDILTIVFQVIGGLGLFLYGMESMSKGMQKMAGEKLKNVLALLAKNRIMAIGVGILVTAVVQSSSVITVMTIGFVNASLLTLRQALGVILGANIGTTATGWILSFEIGKYGLPIAGLAGLSMMFFHSEKAKTRATTIMGLGLLFYGLELMSTGLKPLRTEPSFISIFHFFKADSYFGVLKAAAMGALTTAIIQSSSATLGITITLASQGVIDYPTAVALVLGENVGTTVTALLASLKATINAKRAAYAHTIINVIGVLWATTIFRFYVKALEKFVDPVHNVGYAISTAHTAFNVINVILFIPFVGILAKFLCKLAKGTDEDSKMRVTHLDKLMVDTPQVVVEQTKIEILSMGKEIQEGFSLLMDVFEKNAKVEDKIARIDEIEERTDIYQKEISDINFQILNGTLDAKNIVETRDNLQVCDEYETISDYILRITKTLKKMKDNGIDIGNNKRERLAYIHKHVEDLFATIHLAYEKKDKNAFVDAIRECDYIKQEYKKARAQHLEDASMDMMPTMLSTGYMDILNNYRRIKDHIYNVIELYVKAD